MITTDSVQALDTALFIKDSLCGSVVASGETVYGPASALALPDMAGHAAVSDFAPLTDNLFYSLATLACFCWLCLIIYFYRGYALGIFSVLRGGATTEKILGEQSKIFGSFIVSVISLGILITGLCVLKFFDLFFASYFERLSCWMAALPIFGAWGVIALLWGFQFLLLKAAGCLTLSLEFTDRLFYLKKIVAAIGTITVLPLFLLFALSDGQSAHWLAISIVVIAILLTIFLIIRTFMLFVRQNFSILLWFLYFCAVEIFPVSLAAILAMKAMGQYN